MHKLQLLRGTCGCVLARSVCWSGLRGAGAVLVRSAGMLHRLQLLGDQVSPSVGVSVLVGANASCCIHVAKPSWLNARVLQGAALAKTKCDCW